MFHGNLLPGDSSDDKIGMEARCKGKQSERTFSQQFDSGDGIIWCVNCRHLNQDPPAWDQKRYHSNPKPRTNLRGLTPKSPTQGSSLRQDMGQMDRDQKPADSEIGRSGHPSNHSPFSRSPRNSFILSVDPCFIKANFSEFLSLARKCYLGHLHIL